VLAIPAGQLCFRQLVRGETDDGDDQLGIARVDPLSVERQEGFADHHGGALVAADERMDVDAQTSSR
jgi:hypothetical protein